MTAGADAFFADMATAGVGSATRSFVGPAQLLRRLKDELQAALSCIDQHPYS